MQFEVRQLTVRVDNVVSVLHSFRDLGWPLVLPPIAHLTVRA